MEPFQADHLARLALEEVNPALETPLTKASKVESAEEGQMIRALEAKVANQESQALEWEASEVWEQEPPQASALQQEER